MKYLTKEKFILPLQREEVAASWHERGYSCDLFIDPPGQEWNDFVHPTNELVIVVSGQLKMEMEGEVFVVNPGDEVYIPKMVNHSVINIYHDTTYWLYGYD
ncbi:MAG: cupin domain-containing protein [Proteobacteria bacterium]|nr:cupin domain-containing protein [Pseudomonadota bacterium]